MRAPPAWTRSLLRTTVVATMLGLTLPSGARAQPKPPPSAEAKRYFEVGIKLSKEGLFKEALASFLEAKRLQPRPSIQRNIAQTYRDLHDFAASYDAFSEWLALYEQDKATKKKEIDEIKKALGELRLLTGQVTVQVNEADALLRVDGRDAGKSPLGKPLRLGIGAHQLTATKPGFEPFSLALDVRSDAQSTVTVALRKEVLTGTLRVTLSREVSGAVLLVDGAEKGPLPWEGELPPGARSVEVRAPRGSSAPQQVEITRGQRRELSVTLVEAVGKLSVEVAQAGARISVDGKALGQGVWEGEVPAGSHEVSVELAEFETFRRSVLVRQGESVRLDQITLLRESLPPAAPPPHDYAGQYAQFALLGLAGASSPGTLTAAACPVDGLPKMLGASGCTSNNPLGGGLLLRVGYNTGVVGFDGFVVGSYSQGRGTATYDRGPHVNTQGTQIDANLIRPDESSFYGVSRKENFRFHRFGGDAGVSVRAISHGRVMRFTAGLGGGVSFKWYSVERDLRALYSDARGVASSVNFSSASVPSVRPMLSLDAGLMLGRGSGLKLQVGALMLVEFASEVDSAAKNDKFLGNQGNQATSPIPLGAPSVLMVKGTQIYLGPTLGLHFD